ncbi:MAG: hypothetical protein AAGI17_09885 [Planctomycetota bacterium]
MVDRPDNLFAYADLPRFGLGNVMIPWARSEVFAAQTGARLLAPRWVQPKIGPILRRERDLRLYWGFFSNAGTIRGPRRWLLLRSAKRYPHTEAEAAVEAAKADPGTDHLVVFRFPEWGDEFFGGDGPEHREIISTALEQRLSSNMKRTRDAARATLPDRYIAMHVRRGDKKVMPEGEDKDVNKESIWVMRDAWYASTLASVRDAIGADAPAVIFSDGTDDELADLLAMPGTVRAPASPSIVDILLLAQGEILIGTATSSFSLWASLLAEIPALWYPGVTKMTQPQRPELVIETSERGEITGDQRRVVADAWTGGE